jgi:hypothetical protein
MNKLPKCPFCRTDNDLSVVSAPIGEEVVYGVECGVCRCSGPIAMDEKTAMSLWANWILPEQSITH